MVGLHFAFMAQVIITRSTKTKLLAAAASGERMESWMFRFTRRDRDFQAQLVRVAEEAKNARFFESLREFMADQEREYRRLYGRISEADPRSQEMLRPKDSTVARQPRSKRKRTGPRRTKRIAKMKIELSPNYSPTGVTFAEFLQQRGLYYPKSYKAPFVRVLQGGAIESNRRRH